MLVVTRKRGEAIIIGDGIEVTVLRVGRDGVRLGIAAPRDVQVHRREVYDQIRAANAAAASDASAASELIARLRAGLPPWSSAGSGDP
ncbi:MAG: carbon storage regulator CsrA [Acidobacteria bacterium]|nr:carbon storage regulator CsrA [Acidobacteriota bacterium]